MTVASASPGLITIANARIRFSNGLFEKSLPKGVTDQKALAYNVKLILEPTHPQLKAVMAKIEAAAVATFKGRAKQVLLQAEAAGKVCLRAGDQILGSDGEPYSGYAGNYVLSVRHPHKQPMILGANPRNADGSPNIVDRAASRIYDGCYVNAQVDIFGYTKGSNGITAWIMAVQFAKDGEPLGGGGSSPQVEDFGEVEQSATAAEEFGSLFAGVKG